MGKEELKGVADDKPNETPVVEPTFKEKIVEDVESLQDIKNTIDEKASNLMQKVVDKIDNRIETNVQNEEWKDIVEDEGKEEAPLNESNTINSTIESLQEIENTVKEKT